MTQHVPAGRHTTLWNYLRAATTQPWRGDCIRVATVHSDPREWERTWHEGHRGKRCMGDVSKVLRRTAGLRLPRSGSAGIGIRAERRDNDAPSGMIEWFGHLHRPASRSFANRLQVNPHHIPQFTDENGAPVVSWPGEAVLCGLFPGHSGGILTVHNLDTGQQGEIEVPFSFGLGWSLPVYVGGDCPASAPLVVTIERP